VSIDALATALVQQAPALDPFTIDELRIELRLDGSPLALSIARIVELVGEDLVDQAVALPALAEACAVLVDPHADEPAREAARYRVETLEPVPDRPSPPAGPDVPLGALSRGPRRRT
jgi:hypothetical protein